MGSCQPAYLDLTYHPANPRPAQDCFDFCGVDNLSVRLLLPVSFCLFIAGFSSSLAETPSFEKVVLPVLKNHCVQCHGPKKQKGKVRLDTLSRDFKNDRAAAEIWHDALNALQLGEMPPEDEPPLPDADRKALITWIEASLKTALKSMSGDFQGTVLRRLNRHEYAYTMFDLLGLEMDYASQLPPDPLSPDGFLNNGSALGMSPMQVGVFLETARKALGFVLVEGERPKSEIMPLKSGFKARGKLSKNGPHNDRLGRYHYWGGSTKGMVRGGPFTIRITARTDRKENQPVPILGVDYGYFVSGLTVNFTSPLGQIDIDSSESKTYEICGRAEFSPQPQLNVPVEKLSGAVILRNLLKDGGTPEKPYSPPKEKRQPGEKKKKKKKRGPIYPEDPNFPKIIIEKVEFVSHDFEQWPPRNHKRVVPADVDLSNDDQAAEVIENFLAKAWRRSVTKNELSRWTAHFQKLNGEMNSPIAALRELFAAALTSDHFLYLVEPRGADAKTRPLTGYELASRLSYFLWSSMPDDRLLKLGASGELLKTEVLAGEFDRMLADEKSNRFVDQFSGQWLDLEALDRVAINPQYYKNFDNTLKTDMVEETRSFFDEIFRKDLSALLFLEADFTMANASLAKHYGFEKGPQSQRFERISLAGTSRPGGLLGHASTHMAGSDGADSHPIKRAVWLREKLLHDPPKPPPPNVPDLNESVPNFEKLTVREQLEVHREKAACADCHQGIDPWGIAFERYDAIGMERDKIQKSNKPADPNTVLPGNQKIGGLKDLQKYLVEHRGKQFAEAFTSKLMIYALGRSLDLSDQAVVDELAEEFAADGYRIKNLMKGIVKSNLFLSR